MQRPPAEINSNKISFANCTLDPTFQTLTTPTKVIRLRSKLFFVFCYLVNNENNLVSREELINDCWLGNKYTGQKAITHSICHIRKLIKEQNIPASIITLSKRGYVFRNGQEGYQNS